MKTTELQFKRAKLSALQSAERVFDSFEPEDDKEDNIVYEIMERIYLLQEYYENDINMIEKELLKK